MIKSIHCEDLLVIDIETASCYPTFSDMPLLWQKLWVDKTRFIIPDHETPESFYLSRAGVMAEFAKVVCISVGYFVPGKSGLTIRSIAGEDEYEIIVRFIDFVNFFIIEKKEFLFGGHNIKEFDIPFICRRMLINGMEVPAFLDMRDKKPWEVRMLDTFQYWRFGDFKNYTSLSLLCAALNIPSSKSDMDGSMVGKMFWEKDRALRAININRIARYCSEDVVATANIILRFMSQPLIKRNEVIYDF